MASPDDDMPPARLAALHDGLAHPARVVALRILRERKRMPLADLRREVSARHRAVDTRTMQHHAYKMQLAGLIDVELEDGREVVRLVLDAALRVRAAGR